MNVLVTGGCGYIGSHMTLSLIENDYEVVVLDNFSNSSLESLKRVEVLTGKKVNFIEGDVCDKVLLKHIFSQYNIDHVLHFAGLKSVGESVNKPLQYYENNVLGALSLCHVMDQVGVRNLIFSSSATVYGDAKIMPIHEGIPTGSPTNPYGRSKLMIEEILNDLVKADLGWSVGILRYFNPVGAHPSGVIGEDPNDIPNNLVPFISQVAIGLRKELSIFGNNYDTFDGTGVRDYIHVMDLVDGHLKAMKKISNKTGLEIWNLGTGNGYSVLEIVKAFENASGKKVPFKFVSRREGDVASCWADATKAERELNWKAKCSLVEMMEDTWRWQSNNPNGYKTS
ncbi:UDP-glucose 4-epimerase GalE [Modicisalibacter xianhensis]|uniref:UDP-glucose 4-epimerase n=1 Tax=Modicisalibacter xianhensis TaxID=442341 RepID=A0A1I3C8L5_9GAMM|nr:UDP-glucose 4-epimerase GalE [Halomonas xianhensis]SFH70391.1 UDP-galactose 4-epimerase [Halomonas xianhensis]